MESKEKYLVPNTFWEAVIPGLIANANACKNHLVNGIPQMAIETHVEIAHAAHTIAKASLSIHCESARRSSDKRKREK